MAASFYNVYHDGILVTAIVGNGFYGIIDMWSK